MTSSANLDLPFSPADNQATMRLEVNERHLAIITIDLPSSKLNTLGSQSMNELNDLIDKLTTELSVRGLVIRSGKADNFIAGADVNEIRRLQTQSQEQAYKAAQLGKEVFAKIDTLPFPTVAEINGTCLGGGTELALACDYRIATASAKIGLPEVKLGFVPGWGACIRLPRLVGIEQAIRLITAGRILDGNKAWKIGLVDEVVEPGSLKQKAEEIALGAKPHKHSADMKAIISRLLLETNPIGLYLLRDLSYKAIMRETKGKYPAPKEALNVMIKGLKLPEKKAFELESSTFARLAATSVSKNLVAIFFAQNESKKLPAELSAKPNITTIGVLGAGVMGAGIAQGFANAGYTVVLKDVEDKFLQKGKSTIEGLFGKLVERRRLTQDKADSIVKKIVFTTDYEQLSGCDLVVEAVIEDLGVKQDALRECDRVIEKPYVFASNTSSLSIDKIAEGTDDKSKVVGLHFFNPVHKMPLVEIVRGVKTSNEALAAAMTVALKLDKTTVITGDAAGFVVNRILSPYMREAAILAEEGVPIEDIDKAMKSFGMPMGPFALLDEIGLDIAGKVIHVMEEALGERMSEPKLMKDIKNLQLLGKKGGKGIFLYDANGKVLTAKDGKRKFSVVNPNVQACIKATPRKKTAADIQDRLVLLMVNESARCIEENIVDSAAQLDLAMIFGIGFPPFLGGPLKYADAEGILLIQQKLSLLSRVNGSRYAPCTLIEENAKQAKSFYPPTSH